MKYWGIVLSAVLVLAVTANAQQEMTAAPNPITTLLKQQVTRYSQNIGGAAESMPADKYSFKPTPDMRTFGQLIVHISQFNDLMCSRISGQTSPDVKDLKETDGKDKLAAAVKGSFDFCTTALSGLDDSKLGETVGKIGQMSLSRGTALVILGEDWFDHYSAQAIYLRLNGILPPSAQPK